MPNSYQFDRRQPAPSGALVTLAPGLRRIIAPNPSPMTFTGTATYLVGSGSIAVVDPGPADCGHVGRILDALGPGESVDAILVTHRHVDHSPGATLLRRASGAPVYAAPARKVVRDRALRALLATDPRGGGEGIDPDFVPDMPLTDGATVCAGTGSGERPAWTIRAVHSPGHLDDHMCFAWEERGILFTGDHVMGWSSSMLSPPEGDHREYLESLERLAARVRDGADRVYCPGHGCAVPDPLPLLQHLQERRQQREVLLINALAERPASLAALVRQAYPGIPESLAIAARRNLLAHLVDLHRRNRIALEGAGAPATRFAAVPARG